MSRHQYDVDVLELADDEPCDGGTDLLLERASAPRRWQTEMRHRPRRPSGSQSRNGLHQRRQKHFSC